MRHLYVHVPFCQEICAYCDFFRVKCNDALIDKWLFGLELEIQKYSYEFVDTVYIGGGTPSSLSLGQLGKLLELIQPYTKHVLEYTFEANPESLDLQKIQLLKAFGINRVSLGVQTLDDALLVRIHRHHSKLEVLAVIDLLHSAGITNISIDMMYGLPTQSKTMWLDHLKEIIDWPITHVSIYSLTIEENSEFGRMNLPLIDNELEGEMYEEGCQVLENGLFEQYEVSSFAKHGSYSRHNLGYWQVEDYVGLGCGSHGCLGNLRYENTENITEYVNGNAMKQCEVISLQDKIFEVVMLGLRMKQGISLEAFQRRFHVSLFHHYQTEIETHMEKGFLVQQDGYLKTTSKGMQFLHTVLIDFLKDSIEIKK